MKSIDNTKFDPETSPEFDAAVQAAIERWRAGGTPNFDEKHADLAEKIEALKVVAGDQADAVGAMVVECAGMLLGGYVNHIDGDASAFPGRPGSRWRDTDGDMWVLGDDGRLHAANCSLDPNEAAQAYGPMTRVGGES